jgi:hypothetical protein
VGRLAAREANLADAREACIASCTADARPTFETSLGHLGGEPNDRRIDVRKRATANEPD